MRKVLDERDNMKALLALAEKQLEKQIAAEKIEPSQKRGRGKGTSHRVTVRAEAQRATKKTAK